MKGDETTLKYQWEKLVVFRGCGNNEVNF